MADKILEAVAVLPETAPEFPPPFGIGIEAFHVLVVKPVQPFL